MQQYQIISNDLQKNSPDDKFFVQAEITQALKSERCKRHGRVANSISCNFCSISMYHPEIGFTCEVN